jgi:PII interaction protein X
MGTEIYINHPNFGLLYRLCVIDKNDELFTTLYAQRLFFKVTLQSQGAVFEPVSRTEARMLMDNKLRILRGEGKWQAYQEMNKIYQTTFQ